MAGRSLTRLGNVVSSGGHLLFWVHAVRGIDSANRREGTHLGFQDVTVDSLVNPDKIENIPFVWVLMCLSAGQTAHWIDSSKYSGHSFRSGAATTAAKRGLGDATIEMLGRWQSNAYQNKCTELLYP